MNFWYDVVDWVGGYPYEYASRSRVEQFITAAGFALTRFVPAQVPTGCNEFVFRRQIHPTTGATVESR
jgi:2-polyprenyl-6-hydroxyphenyl methylase/3-demethylubiquinone-9 3-methyltransferase